MTTTTTPHSRNHYGIFSFMVVLLFLGESSADYYRKIISAGTLNLPCDISNSDGELYTAINYINEEPSTTLSSVTLGGWLFPRGYLDQYYTIFSFHDTTSFMIYSVAYSPNDFTIRSTLGTSVINIQTVPAFTTLQWFFVRSYIEYSSSKLTGGTSIWNSKSPLFSSNLSNASEHLYDFTKSTLLFNIGNSNANLAGSVVPSCSVSRFICAYSSKVEESELQTSRDNIQGTSVELIWHYDEFYTTNNPGFLMSFGKSEDALIIPTLNTQPLYFSSGQTLASDYIKANNNLGFTVQFSLKMSSPTLSSSKCRILTISEDAAYIDIITGSKISASGQSNISSVDFAEWIQFVVSIKYGIENLMLLTALNYHSQKKQLSIPKYRTLRLLFGSTQNIDEFRISSIRIYQGIYISSSTECYFGVPILPVNNCLACSSSYRIDFQNDYACELIASTTPDSDYPFQTAFSPSRTVCPPGQIHDLPSSTSCRCRQQQYTNTSNECLPCKRYCNGCTGTSTTCVTQDPLRNANGTCQTGTFDDGYNCLNTDQLLPDTPFPTHTFATPTYISAVLQTQSILFDDSFLGVENESSLLFTFAYEPSTTTYYNSAIATVILNSSEVITFLIESTSVGKQFKLLILGTVKWTYYIHPNNASWYALWSDLLTTTVFIHTNGMLYSNSFSLSIAQPMASPHICIGSCYSTYTSAGTPLSLGILNNRPFRFIVNALNPALYDEQILNLILLDAVILANFALNLQSYSTSYLGQYESMDTLNVKMNFYSTSTIVTSQLKGFGFFFENTYASVDIGQFDFPISFSTTLWIDKLNSQTTILSYDFTGDVIVEYYLVPSQLQSNAFIRICFGYECQDTESTAKLYIGEANFLAILTMDLSPFSEEFLRIQFKIICNYASETLTFIIARPVVTPSSQLVNIGVQSEITKNYVIYLNRLLLINGNSYFYEDYSDSNSCFLSINNNPNTCIYPKDGYALFNGGILTESKCVSDSTTIRFVNQNTKECIDSLQPKSKCVIVDENTLYCLECTFGYYLPTGETYCEPCSLPCTSCIDQSTYCLTCYEPTRQIAPSCDCAEQGYFMNANYSCQICDSRCDTCIDSATNCTTCAADRNSPPSCICDSIFTEDNLTFDCVLMACESQCETCSGSSSNCETCKSNRGTPPLCECPPNSFEVSDGTCETCPSGTYYSAANLQCLPCSLPCTECVGTGSFCLACDSDLTLKDNKCYCMNNSSYIIKSTGQLFCANKMDINQFTFSVNENLVFVLEFVFEKQLYPNYIESTPADELVSVYLNDVQSDWYSLTNPRVSANTFAVDLVAQKAFAATSGYVIFLQTIPSFISISEEDVLDEIYLAIPFKIKKIGPLVFSKTDPILPNISISDSVELSALIQGLQLVFYFLNSLQPTVILLLVQAQLPPNLYSFLQTIGQYIFPDMQNYQEEKEPQNYQYFDFDLQASQLMSNNEFMFRRLGFLSSLMTTIPLVCFKYIVLFFLLSITLIWSQLGYRQDLSQKWKGYVIEQLITENEVNLLIAGMSLLIQMGNTDEESWISRYGFYFSIAIAFLHLFSFYSMATQVYLNTCNIKETQSSPYLEALMSRIKAKWRSQSKNYFLFQMIKKYLILVVVYAFKNFPQTVCLLCALIFLISSISTIKLKPYLKVRSRNVKIIVDFNFFITWLVMTKIVAVEFELYGEQPFDEDKVKLFYDLGYIVAIVLVASNFIYVIEQICCIVDKILEISQKKRQQQQHPLKTV